MFPLHHYALHWESGDSSLAQNKTVLTVLTPEAFASFEICFFAAEMFLPLKILPFPFLPPIID